MVLSERVIGCVAYGSIALYLAIPMSALAQESVVATVGKQTITVQDLEVHAAAKLAARQSDYDLRLRQLKLSFERGRQEFREQELGALVDDAVLALEAKARKTTTDALLAAVKPPPATDAQIRGFYDAQRNQINQPYDSVAEKIKEYLEKNERDAARRHYLDSLRAKYHAAMT
ncbi:MAG TPA: hypothetical protein VGD54_14565, partial [Steroidobacteraceae bacterium]